MTSPAITAIVLAALASTAACVPSAPPPAVPAASAAQTPVERLGLRALNACMSGQTVDEMQAALRRAGFSFVGEIVGDRTLREPTGAVSGILTSNPLSAATCLVNMTGVTNDRALSFVQSALQQLDGPPARLGDDLVRTGWTGTYRGKPVVIAVLTLGSQGPDASIVYDIRQ